MGRHRDPEWYEDRIADIKKKKRTLNANRQGKQGKKVKEEKQDLIREKRACKRGEKQDAIKRISDEIIRWEDDRGYKEE